LRRSLGIKGDVVLDVLRDFMVERLFGPLATPSMSAGGQRGAERTGRSNRPNGRGPGKQRPAGPSQPKSRRLDAIPDLSKTLENASEDELTELLDAFNVSVSYDKPAKKLELSAVIAPDLDPETAGCRSGDSFIAGAGFEPAIVVHVADYRAFSSIGAGTRSKSRPSRSSL
jgi:hypothetical protein